MAVTSSSTDAQVIAQYEDNADYDLQSTESGGISKAKLFIHAGRILLSRLRAQMSKGDKSVANDLGMRREEVDAAVKWLRGTSQTDGTVTLPDMRDFR